MALVYNGNTVQKIIFNGQTVKRAEFNGNVVFIPEITVTVTLNNFELHNEVTATISATQFLGDDDTVKVIVRQESSTVMPQPTEIYLTKTNPTVTHSSDRNAFYYRCEVLNASNFVIGSKTFNPLDLTATFTGPLYGSL